MALFAPATATLTTSVPLALKTVYEGTFALTAITQGYLSPLLESLGQTKKIYGREMALDVYSAATPIKAQDSFVIAEGGDPTIRRMASTVRKLSYKQHSEGVEITELADLYTNGDIGRAAFAHLGREYASYMDSLSCTPIEQVAGETPTIFANGKTQATIAASDVMTLDQLQRMSTIFARENVPKFANGKWVAALSTNQIYDLTKSAGTLWETYKYANPNSLVDAKTNGPVASLFGFDIYQIPMLDAIAAESTDTVKTVRSMFFGDGGLVKTNTGSGVLIFDKAQGIAETSRTIAWKENTNYHVYRPEFVRFVKTGFTAV